MFGQKSSSGIGGILLANSVLPADAAQWNVALLQPCGLGDIVKRMEIILDVKVSASISVGLFTNNDSTNNHYRCGTGLFPTLFVPVLNANNIAHVWLDWTGNFEYCVSGISKTWTLNGAGNPTTALTGSTIRNAGFLINSISAIGISDVAPVGNRILMGSRITAIGYQS
jgi:hypothetical protein